VITTTRYGVVSTVAVRTLVNEQEVSKLISDAWTVLVLFVCCVLFIYLTNTFLFGLIEVVYNHLRG
jgi:hypothetical protein